MDLLRDALMSTVFNTMQYYAPQIEADMKLEAVWQDRTANARQTLYSEAGQPNVDWVVLVASQLMDYGVYLEGVNPDGRPMTRRNAQHYRIVIPTLDHYVPVMWEDIKRVIGG